MAKDTRLSTLVVNVQADALATLADDGWLDVYGGDRPATPDEPIDDRKRAASLRLGKPAFARAKDGVLSANPIAMAVAVLDVNPVTWARITASDHKTALWDVSVGTKDANVILPTTNVAAGVSISVSSFTHRVAKSSPGS